MSYNGYQNANNYSPYYQQIQGQDGRGQYQDQARNGASYQSNEYQPLSAFQSNRHQQASAPQSTPVSAYAGQGYGSARSQDPRGAYLSGGRPIDTSALGNLAYVSSLGRDNTSFAQNTSGYNNTESHMNFAGRTTSSGPTDVSTEVVNARSQQTTPLPSHGYNSGRDAGYQGHQAYLRPQAQVYAPATTPQASRSSANSQNSTEIVRPASGQPTHDKHSRRASQASHTGITRANQSADINESEQSRVQSPLQPVYQSSGIVTEPSRTTAQIQQVRSASSKAKGQKLPSTVSSSGSAPAKNAHQASIGDSQVDSNNSRTSTPVGNQYPTTVDPSQVFNHHEYSRRQAAAAEAEASKNKVTKGGQAAAPVTGSSQGTSSRQQNETTSNNEGQSSNADPDTAKKIQMELEMKQMIEKMRDYKSKDPSLFTQIWEQVKKSQPAPRAPSQPAAQDTSISPIIVNDQARSPSTAQSHLPPESELPAAQSNESEDRGRFPAQRRRRGGKNHTPLKGSTKPRDDLAPSTSSSNPDGLSVQTPATSNSGSQKLPAGQPAPSAAGIKSQPQNRSLVTPNPAKEVSQQQSQLRRPGETYWPENKKQKLAEAARITLTTDPQNAGKQITTVEVHDLLDQNPSYLQMCEILESRGFVIDRSQFARTLLSAVPDLGAATAPDAQKRKPPTGSPISVVHPVAQNGVPRPLPFSAPPVAPMYHTPYPTPNAAVSSTGVPLMWRNYHLVHPSSWTLEERRHHQDAMARYRNYDNAREAMSSPNVSRPDSRSADVNAGFTGPTTNSFEKIVDERSQTNGANTLSKESVNASYVPTKQDLARKRSFGDIVDLTQLSDDERLSQRPRLDDDRPVNRHHQVSFPQPVTMRSGMVESAPEQATSSLKKPVNTKPSSRQYLWSQPDIIRPMNKRQDALRRSSYDSRTIARDILLAVGKHPTMAPLNSHLDNLREKFTAVNYDSDLSTFRWDLIDPGDPAPAETGDANDTDNKKPHTPSSRSLLSRHRPRISVVVGADTGGGVGGGSGDGGVLSSPVERSVTTPARDGTARRPRGRPSRGGHTFPSSRYRPHESELPTQHRGASDQQQGTLGQPRDGQPEDGQPQDSQNQHQSSHAGRVTSQKTANRDFSRFIYTDPSSTPKSNTATTPGSDAVPKRRGRPPGVKNKTPQSNKGIPKTDIAKHISSGSGIPGPARPRINGIVTTPVKSSGLRHALTPTNGVAVVIPSPSRSPSVVNTPQTGSAKWGGPQPSYKIYRCLWEQCPAELHNLETLKKHARKHREKSGAGLFPCLWANCYDGNTSITDGSQAKNRRQRLRFDSDTAWQDHMEKKHLDAVAWEVGGGPTTHSSDNNSSDPYGHQSTPGA